MITDVGMPGFSGPVLAEPLAAARPQTRVIYISGDPEGATLRHGIQGPRYAFLEKPFTCEDLVGEVRQVLDLPTSQSA
jgi:two-component system cell cycle sensor histidine kinase/response regulator CckA